MNKIHQANQKNWDDSAAYWKELRDRDQLWRDCPNQPDLAFDGGMLDLIRAYAGELRGKRACVIGSGDNYAAFALAGMGAEVTSSDISQKQLDVAAARADILGLNITFIQADAADMHPIEPNSFDLVCSTNGFFVWISDLGAVFTEAARILKPGGHYIFYDIHPFQRPWKDQVTPIEMEKPYTATGPFVFEEAYEFNWRLSDLIKPLLEAGLTLRKLLESPPKDPRFWLGPSYVPGNDQSLLDWRNNPRAGLPVWLTLAAEKPDSK